MHTKTKNQEIFERLLEVIPGGVNSPVRSCKAMGQNPLVASMAKGDLIYDADGKSFIDYCCSWGPLIHGHAHPEIIAAAQRRMALGTTFGVTTGIEEEMARKVTQLMPSIEKVRFVSSGTEASMSAARLARGFTGRDMLVKFAGHYHGHADFFLIQAGSGVLGLNATSSSKGIPEDIVKHTVCLKFNDVENTRSFLYENRDKIAGVILEPIAANMGVVPTQPTLMQMLRKVTEEIGALLIIDEVITGFRVGLQGAQGLYGVKPDLTLLGKIVGGGFPAAAFGGRREIMDYLAPLGPVYQAGTLSGNPVAMEAGLQTIKMLEVPGFYEGLLRKTNSLTQPIQATIDRLQLPACIQQVGSLFTLFFGARKVENMDDAKGLDALRFAEFFRYMYENGVYIPPLQQEAWFLSTAHTEEHIAYTRELVIKFLER